MPGDQVFTNNLYQIAKMAFVTKFLKNSSLEISICQTST